jgi:hypothetical protein
MKERKHHLKSITIWSQLIIIVCVMFLANPPTPLTEKNLTMDALLDWAIAMGRGQRVLFICTIIISCNLIGIWGRMRATKGLGKDEK